MGQVLCLVSKIQPRELKASLKIFKLFLDSIVLNSKGGNNQRNYVKLRNKLDSEYLGPLAPLFAFELTKLFFIFPNELIK